MADNNNHMEDSDDAKARLQSRSAIEGRVSRQSFDGIPGGSNAFSIETIISDERQSDSRNDSEKRPSLKTVNAPCEAHDNDSSNASKDAAPAWFKETLQLLADQWFLIALGLLIAIASQVQVPLTSQKVKRTVTSYLCISIIFFVYAFDVVRFMLRDVLTISVAAGQVAYSTPRSCSRTTADGRSTSSFRFNVSS